MSLLLLKKTSNNAVMYDDSKRKYADASDDNALIPIGAIIGISVIFGLVGVAGVGLLIYKISRNSSATHSITLSASPTRMINNPSQFPEEELKESNLCTVIKQMWDEQMTKYKDKTETEKYTIHYQCDHTENNNNLSKECLFNQIFNKSPEEVVKKLTDNNAWSGITISEDFTENIYTDLQISCSDIWKEINKDLEKYVELDTSTSVVVGQ